MSRNSNANRIGRVDDPAVVGGAGKETTEHGHANTDGCRTPKARGPECTDSVRSGEFEHHFAHEGPELKVLVRVEVCDWNTQCLDALELRGYSRGADPHRVDVDRLRVVRHLRARFHHLRFEASRISAQFGDDWWKEGHRRQPRCRLLAGYRGEALASAKSTPV